MAVSDLRWWNDWVASLLNVKEFRKIAKEAGTRKNAEEEVLIEIKEKVKDRLRKDRDAGNKRAGTMLRDLEQKSPREQKYRKIWKELETQAHNLVEDKDIIIPFAEFDVTQDALRKKEKKFLGEIQKMVDETKDDLRDLNSQSRKIQRAIKIREGEVLKKLREDLKGDPELLAKAINDFKLYYSDLRTNSVSAIKQSKKEAIAKLGKETREQILLGKTFPNLQKYKDIQDVLKLADDPEKALERIGLRSVIEIDKNKRIVYKIFQSREAIGEQISESKEIMRSYLNRKTMPDINEFQRLIDRIKEYGLIPAKGKNSYHFIIDQYVKMMKREGRDLSKERIERLRAPAYKIEIPEVRLPKKLTAELKDYPDSIRPILKGYLDAFPSPGTPPKKLDTVMKKLGNEQTIKEMSSKDLYNIKIYSASLAQEFKEQYGELLNIQREIKRLKAEDLPVPEKLLLESVDVGKRMGELKKWHSILTKEMKQANGLFNPKFQKKVAAITAINFAVLPPSRIAEPAEAKAIKTLLPKPLRITPTNIADVEALLSTANKVNKKALMKAGLTEAQAEAITSRIKEVAGAIKESKKLDTTNVLSATTELKRSYEEDIEKKREEIETIKIEKPEMAIKKEGIIKEEISDLRQDIKELEAEERESFNPWKAKKAPSPEDFVAKIDKEMDQQINKLVKSKTLPSRILLESRPPTPLGKKRNKRKLLEELMGEEKEE